MRPLQKRGPHMPPRNRKMRLPTLDERKKMREMREKLLGLRTGHWV